LPEKKEGESAQFLKIRLRGRRRKRGKAEPRNIFCAVDRCKGTLTARKGDRLTTKGSGMMKVGRAGKGESGDIQTPGKRGVRDSLYPYSVPALRKGTAAEGSRGRGRRQIHINRRKKGHNSFHSAGEERNQRGN